MLLKLMAKLNSHTVNQLLPFIPAVVTTALKCNELGCLVLEEHHVVPPAGAPWLCLIFFFLVFKQVNKTLPPPACCELTLDAAVSATVAVLWLCAQTQPLFSAASDDKLPSFYISPWIIFSRDPHDNKKPSLPCQVLGIYCAFH